MLNKTYFLIAVVIVIVAAVTGGILLTGKKSAEPFACTAEAKLCSDGSAVGRVGPNCEFAACPGEDNQNSGGQETLCQPKQRNADFCTADYMPVCAKVEIQCIKAPCNPIQQTFSNSCNACKNSLVKSYVVGECQKIDSY